MKNSLLYLRENLMWTSTGTVWAMWRVHGLPYGFGKGCLLYTSPSPRDKRQSRMPSSA